MPLAEKKKEESKRREARGQKMGVFELVGKEAKERRRRGEGEKSHRSRLRRLKDPLARF